MALHWFNPREATRVGIALADQIAPQLATLDASGNSHIERAKTYALQELLRSADREAFTLRLNFYKKAKLANSFKWRLIEKGVASQTASEVTQSLILHFSLNRLRSAIGHNSSAATPNKPRIDSFEYLLAQGNGHLSRGAYAEAIPFYKDSLKLKPRHAAVLNNLGSALCKLGRYGEAQESFRLAINFKPDFPEAHNNLGAVLRWRGQIAESEIPLRRALKLKPNFTDARYSLGYTLLLLGRLRDAKARFEKVLKVAPRHADALFGMGQIARMEGHFERAETLFKRALEVNPKMSSALAALVSIRKMTPADAAWLEAAEEIAASGLAPLERADVCFAIGKYWDDTRNFERAFLNYKHANELLKSVAEHYERDLRTRFVDDLVCVYTREKISKPGAGASDSTKPVFVVGMMRSGTSLAEQIIASHPSASGAGELAFWSDAVREHETAIRQGTLGETIRRNLAEQYLSVLASRSVDALRIVDKAPINSDFLGIIHSVFPRARFIYMRRDPIDTCLSCYFQQFSVGLNYTMELSDLAHYYREHQRLIAHWRAVLPPETILELPYEGLVADQEEWTRKILDFLGLEWDDGCLDFHNTNRPVVTASYWQVRQRIYKGSVERWRNYETFVGPLLGLRNSGH
jgi:tetratricopeptide (TPR) repeat protein